MGTLVKVAICLALLLELFSLHLTHYTTVTRGNCSVDKNEKPIFKCIKSCLLSI